MCCGTWFHSIPDCFLIPGENRQRGWWWMFEAYLLMIAMKPNSQRYAFAWGPPLLDQSRTGKRVVRRWNLERMRNEPIVGTPVRKQAELRNTTSYENGGHKILIFSLNRPFISNSLVNFKFISRKTGNTCCLIILWSKVPDFKLRQHLLDHYRSSRKMWLSNVRQPPYFSTGKQFLHCSC